MQSSSFDTYFHYSIFWLLIFGLLTLVAFHNYILFHSLTEIFSIVIAGGIFMFAWASRNILSSYYLLFIGIAYLFVGLTDLLHTLSYKGMEILPDYRANEATQLWIAARYIESLSLLAAPVFLKKRLRPDLIFAGFSLLFALILYSIFFSDLFPACYLEGQGLTPFKIISEYLICLLLIAAGSYLYYYRHHFEQGVFKLIIASILLTMIAELAFTTYISVYGWANFAGHLLKILSFSCIYLAIIETGLTRPYSLLFRDLKKSREEERLAKKELQQERNALKESEERFRTLADNISQLVWMADDRGQIFWYNKRWHEYTGTGFEEIVSADWHKTLHPEYADRVAEKMSRFFEYGEVWEDTFPLLGKDGQYRWFLSRAVPIGNEEGGILRWFGTHTDITELRDAQLSTEKMAAELARSNQELDQFAHIASHDLKEPLNSVTGFLSLLSRRYQGKLDAEADKFISFAVKGAQRMQQLIDDILTFSQVNTGKNTFITTDCQGVLEEALANLHSTIEESKAEVTYDELPVVTADRNQLMQLFQNLIGNALNYRKDDESPRIHITAKEKKTGWEFQVNDNGIGIESDQQERIFQIFQRLHTEEKYSGTGIGLATSKKIVELHGGRIWVESEIGRGSSFFFTLPAT